MAAGTKGDFVIYHDEFYAGNHEGIDQNIDLWNAASRGTIRLVSERSKGDYQKESFIDDLAMISRRITSGAGSTDVVADTPMTQSEMVRPKVNRRIGPIAQTLDAWKKIGTSASEFSMKYGQKVSEKQGQDMVNTAIKSAVAAIAGTATVTVPDTGAVITHANLNTGLALFGDASNDIVAWVMHSKVWHDLVGGALTLATSHDTVNGTAVFNGTTGSLNRPVIVADCPDLVIAGTPTNYNTLGLTADAVTVMISEEESIESDMVTGLENLVMRIQGEYAYNIGIKGYAWDIANGAENPNDTALELATNWDKVVSSDKHTAGIAIVTE